MPIKKRSISKSKIAKGGKRKSKSKKKSKGGKRKMSAGVKKWHNHLMKFYREKKAKNPSYRFSNAMKEAKKTYKKI